MPDVPLHNVGDVVNGRYLIAELLGHGASGEVYVAKDPSRNGTELAVKYLRWLPNKPTQLDQFKTEFAMLTHLSHPHIAKVHDFEQDDSNAQFFFTSELIRGKDFITATQGLSIEGIEELFVQALRALEYIHGNGIFHFDIKAANVLVTDPVETIKDKVLRGNSCQAKLIDFGLAAIRYQGKLAGTPSYMAPEMVRRENPDGRADLYSLGALVYTALTGSNPFRTTDMNQTMQNQLNLVPPPPSQVNPDVPPHLDAILMRLLEKSATDRFQTAAQTIRDLNLRSPKKYSVETEETQVSYIPWESKFIGRLPEIAKVTSLLHDKRSVVVVVKGASGSGKSRFLTEVKYQAQVAEWATFFLTDPTKFEEWQKNAVTEHKQPALFAIDDHHLVTTELWGHHIEDACKRLTRQIFAKKKNKQPVILMLATAYHCEAVHPEPVEGGTAEAIPLTQSSDSLSIDPTSETVEIELSNFTLEDIRDYLATITGIPSPPQALVEQVHTNTGGNPFMVTEVIKTLVGSGMLVDSQGRWKSTTFEDIKIDLAKMNVPSNIEDRLLRDMADVSDEALSFAQMMAVFGRPMSVAETEKISGSSTARGALMMLSRRGLVRFDPSEGLYYFARPLLAKAIYSRMSESDRTYWHDKIAKMVGSSGLQPAMESSSTLLYHLSRGSDQQAAKGALKKLVEVCTLSQHNHDAILHAQYYLEKWNEPEMRLNLARLYNRIGKYDLAIKTAEDIGNSPPCTPVIARSGESTLSPPFEKGGRKAPLGPRPITGPGGISPEDTVELSEATRKHEVTALEIIGTSYLWQKNFNAASQHFLAALQMTEHMPLPQKLRIENFLAEVAYFEGNIVRATEIYERTAKVAEALTHDEQLQIKNNNLGQAYFQKGEYAKAVVQLEKELKFYETIGDSRLIARTRYSLAESLRMDKHFEGAKKAFDALVEHAKDVDDVEHLFRAYNGLGNLHFDNGDVASAAKYYERALDVATRAGFEEQSISCVANLGIISSSSGDFKKAVEHFSSVLAFLEGCRTSGGLMGLYHCRVHLEMGEIARLERQFAESHKHLDEAAELASSPACKELFFWVRLTQAKLAKDEGDVPAQQVLMADLKDLATTPEKQAALKFGT